MALIDDIWKGVGDCPQCDSNLAQSVVKSVKLDLRENKVYFDGVFVGNIIEIKADGRGAGNGYGVKGVFQYVSKNEYLNGTKVEFETVSGGNDFE